MDEKLEAVKITIQGVTDLGNEPILATGLISASALEDWPRGIENSLAFHFHNLAAQATIKIQDFAPI